MSVAFCEPLERNGLMMSTSNNDNVNPFKGFSLTSVNDRCRQIDLDAMAVCRKMGNEGDRIAFKLYCKAFYHLAPVTIWDSVELAKEKGRSPVKYLSWLLTKELEKCNIK